MSRTTNKRIITERYYKTHKWPRGPMPPGLINLWGPTPSWWNREFHRKPARAEERMLLTRVMRDGDTDDRWPDMKKPHHYYW